MMEQAHSPRVRGRSGWSYEETAALFDEARRADQEGRSIKSVFDRVATITGRKPNSIRNYYYSKLKENHELGKITFVPFTEEEVSSLMKTMLTEQAKGRSVRGIAMELGGGDKKSMLRFQNKYRSVVRSNPDYVKSLMEELKSSGMPSFDPFVEKRPGKKRDISVIMAELVENLSTFGVDAENFFSILNTFAKNAAGKNPGIQSAETTEAIRKRDREISSLTEEISALKRENEAIKKELSDIVELNKSFAEKDGLDRISGLAEYVGSVQRLISGQ